MSAGERLQDMTSAGLIKRVRYHLEEARAIEIYTDLDVPPPLWRKVAHLGWATRVDGIHRERFGISAEAIVRSTSGERYAQRLRPQTGGQING